MPHPADSDPTGAAPDALSIAVERSGGFAGLTRQWSVTTSAADPHWHSLVDQCPWPGASAPQRPAPTAHSGADRFCWRVTATIRGEMLSADLTENDVRGAWRTLIDAVRDHGADSTSLVEEREQ